MSDPVRDMYRGIAMYEQETGRCWHTQVRLGRCTCTVCMPATRPELMAEAVWVSPEALETLLADAPPDLRDVQGVIKREVASKLAEEEGQ